MKKTCDNCKAIPSDFYRETCLLEYLIKTENRGITITGYMEQLRYIPLQECPKPLTYKKLIELKRN